MIPIGLYTWWAKIWMGKSVHSKSADGWVDLKLGVMVTGDQYHWTSTMYMWTMWAVSHVNHELWAMWTVWVMWTMPTIKSHVNHGNQVNLWAMSHVNCEPWEYLVWTMSCVNSSQVNCKHHQSMLKCEIWRDVTLKHCMLASTEICDIFSPKNSS